MGAIDTTRVSPIRGDGEPRHLRVDHDGTALAQARRRKQRTYPEFGVIDERLVVLAVAARVFVSQLAKAKTWSVLRVLARPARLGSTVGPLSWRVRVPRLLCPCWTAALLLVPTESCLALQPSPLAATCVCFFQTVTVTQQETRLPLMSPISLDENVAQRGCKLFMQLPRMLLYCPALGGLISKEKSRASFWSLCWGTSGCSSSR